jgi:hypothetical protein
MNYSEQYVNILPICLSYVVMCSQCRMHISNLYDDKRRTVVRTVKYTINNQSRASVQNKHRPTTYCIS